MPDPIPGSPALSAEELAGLRDLHRRDPHYPLDFCRACLHVTPCPTRRLLNAYEEAVEAFGATPALLESVSRTALASVQEAWDARDAQRARAEAAELRAGELDKEADVFCQAYRWMLADRDRERRRADKAEALARVNLKALMQLTEQNNRLAARVVSLEEALADAQTGMEWALSDDTRLGFWACDCDPGYEYDTNATIHEDNCASLWEGHFEATMERLKALRGAGEVSDVLR